MAFDVESGVGGASAGSVAGPYGAAAGFVIGGFLGGKAKKKAKREQRQRNAEIRRISSPENYLATIKKLTPKFREQVASGMAPALQGSIASTLARRNLTGTGVGEAVRNLGQIVPGVEAGRMASQSAGDIINRQLRALTGERNVQSGEPPVSVETGTQIAQIAALFRALGGGRQQRNTPVSGPVEPAVRVDERTGLPVDYSTSSLFPQIQPSGRF